jgi:hypothetical protein
MILDLIALDNSSKVWIYQSDKEFTYDELDYAREDIFHFLSEWTAHSAELDSYGNIFHKRFLAFFVDESKAHASGCSIDTSVRFVEALGKKMNKDFFDRMTYAYMDEEEDIHTLHHNNLSGAYADGKVFDSTFFFNNLVKTKGDFLTNWIRPLDESWHKRFV